MKVEEPDLRGNYSYKDYLTWNWDQMVELIFTKCLLPRAANTRGYHSVAARHL
jgi:hypothetical protein